MFYKYDTANEKVWRAGAKDIVISSQAYSDLMISHAIILPIKGMEVIVTLIPLFCVENFFTFFMMYLLYVKILPG